MERVSLVVEFMISKYIVLDSIIHTKSWRKKIKMQFN